MNAKNSVLLKNAECFIKNNFNKLDIYIKNNLIHKIDTNINIKTENTYDCTGLTIFPGFIDTQVHFREPGNPEKETLENFAKSEAVLAIHLSIQNIETVVKKLAPFYGENCPVKVIWQVSWPDEEIIHSSLGSIVNDLPGYMKRTALILVGKYLDTETFENSKLYDEEYERRFRTVNVGKKFEK